MDRGNSPVTLSLRNKDNKQTDPNIGQKDRIKTDLVEP